MPKFPITTFAPDASPLTPGVLVDLAGAYPSEDGGMKATPTLSEATTALPSQVLSSFAFQDVNGNYRHIAAVQDKLYELTGAAWQDVSGTTSYANVTRWRYAPYGNWILATDINTPMQVQTASLAAFADQTGSPPQAAYITAVKEVVILANLDGHPQRVQWCAMGDSTDWTPSLTTQAGYTDLQDTAGPNTAIHKLGDTYVVFKEHTLYLAYYSGAPYTWTFQRIAASSGTVCSDAIVEMDGALFYPGLDDFYVFDGTFPRRIGQGIRDWFFSTVDGKFMSQMKATFDLERRLIFWWYPTKATGDGSIQECLIFDVVSRRWGRMIQPIEEVMGIWQTGVTYADISNYFNTYADITTSGLTYGSPFWSASQINVGAFTINHKLGVLGGTPGTCTMVTGDIGDQVKFSRIRQLFPYFKTTPTTLEVKARSKTGMGDTPVEGSVNSLKVDGGVDLDLTGKFLSLDMLMTGDFEIEGFDADIIPVSVRGGKPVGTVQGWGSGWGL